MTPKTTPAPECNWPRCHRKPNPCFAWCKCQCHTPAPTPETPAGGLTAAETDLLGPFIWGGWIGVAKGKEARYSQELRDTVAKIKADAVAAAVVQARAEDRARIEAEDDAAVNITVTGFHLTPAEGEALFDRVADAAHALNQQVCCSMTTTATEDGDPT